MPGNGVTQPAVIEAVVGLMDWPWPIGIPLEEVGKEVGTKGNPLHLLMLDMLT